MLPDFGSLFRREKVSPLHFRSRCGANFTHDVVFLSSYLHDGHFSPASMTRRGKTLKIEIMRDCWELGFTTRPSCKELHIARSRLTISPVSSIRWEIDDPSIFGEELSIEGIYLGPDHWETPEASELVIAAPHGGWRLRISIPEDFADIRLDDLETPYLWSVQNA